MITTVPLTETCDCCGSSAAARGRYGWQVIGSGPTREVYCEPCRKGEAARAKDVMIP